MSRMESDYEYRRDVQTADGRRPLMAGYPTSVPVPDWNESISDSTQHGRQINSAPSPGPPFSPFNHHHLSSPAATTNLLYHPPAVLPLRPSSSLSRSTLWWGEFEPWMDEEYAKQVCALMGWDPVSIKIPHPAPDPSTGQQANNPGYCFLTFPTSTHASTVLSQITSTPSPLTMPNSTKPFNLNWASAVPLPPVNPIPNAFVPQQQQQHQNFTKEYSIFVGDLAPETSNSDLVAVFRNPVLGLRNDREPKFIQPFLSCKSAKIMLDPVSGVSRGYGFVRFTDEADQQRALIEMHGLYCLSRPMRISPATAKFKPPPTTDLPQVQFPTDPTLANSSSPNGTTKNASASIPATISSSSLNSNSSGSTTSNTSNVSGASSSTAFSNTSTHSAEDMMNLPNSVLAQIAQKYANGEASPPKLPPPAPSSSITSQFVQHDARYGMNSEESWKHHAQARAILGNLIGPNGEQLTSTDPYNTTVFVGGLSPLISEDTLRTFFAPFGDIHYVKVPVGKHCGFVQFVRKADAERAIEKMQGFPVGGSRIRLSWGRSQYKAAQAAAQAAQGAVFQSRVAQPTPSSALTRAQALQMLQKLAAQGYLNQPIPLTPVQPEIYAPGGGMFGDERLRAALLTSREDVRPFEYYPGLYSTTRLSEAAITSSFAPFSPDPNVFMNQFARQGSVEALPHPSRVYASGFFSSGDGAGDNNKPSRDAAVHDLNGSMANLNMDRDRPWKSPAESSESSSGASVQFQMTASSP